MAKRESKKVKNALISGERGRVSPYKQKNVYPDCHYYWCYLLFLPTGASRSREKKAGGDGPLDGGRKGAE